MKLTIWREGEYAWFDRLGSGRVFLEKFPLLRVLRAGTPEVEVDGRLASEPVLIKQFASAFFGTALMSFLTSHSCNTAVVTSCTPQLCAPRWSMLYNMVSAPVKVIIGHLLHRTIAVASQMRSLWPTTGKRKIGNFTSMLRPAKFGRRPLKIGTDGQSIESRWHLSAFPPPDTH